MAEEKIVVRGDPRESEEAYERFVDALWSTYYDVGREKVVYATFRFEDGDYIVFTVTAPFNSEDLEYAVVMDEDGRPLWVVDFSAVTRREATGALLSLISEDAGTIVQVEIEVGERW